MLFLNQTAMDKEGIKKQQRKQSSLFTYEKKGQ